MAASNYQGEPQNSREAQMLHQLQNQFSKVVENPGITGTCGDLSLYWDFIHQKIPFLGFGGVVDRSRNHCP